MKEIRSSVFIATSLDGYIAREDGGLDWLDAANATVPAGEDCGFQAFMDAIDTLVMGRNTYEKVLSLGDWPYGGKPVVVLSQSQISIPSSISNTVTHSSETPAVLCQRLAKSGNRRLYIDGGITIQRFLADRLINDLTITTIPVLLGGGIPLFGKLDSDISLKHIQTRTYDFGFVQSTYEVI